MVHYNWTYLHILCQCVLEHAGNTRKFAEVHLFVHKWQYLVRSVLLFDKSQGWSGVDKTIGNGWLLLHCAYFFFSRLFLIFRFFRGENTWTVVGRGDEALSENSGLSPFLRSYHWYVARSLSRINPVASRVLCRRGRETVAAWESAPLLEPFTFFFSSLFSRSLRVSVYSTTRHIHPRVNKWIRFIIIFLNASSHGLLVQMSGSEWWWQRNISRSAESAQSEERD